MGLLTVALMGLLMTFSNLGAACMSFICGQLIVGRCYMAGMVNVYTQHHLLLTAVMMMSAPFIHPSHLS
jgi:hypothetical protein